MTTIAKLTKQQDGSFLGTLSGIGLQPKKIHLQPVESDNDKAPNYLVILDDMEIGAAFDRENKRGEYTLVVLDSPVLAGPIFSYLRKNVKAGYTLEWERQPPQGPERRGVINQRPRHCAGAASFHEWRKSWTQFHLTDPEPLESFELDEYADQEEIMLRAQGNA